MRSAITVTLVLLVGAILLSSPAAYGQCPFASGQPACAGHSAQAGQGEANKKIVGEYLQSITDPGFKDWGKYFAENVSFNGTAMPAQSIGGILAFFRQGFPDLKYTPMGQIAEGDRVATWGFFEGTHAGEFQGVAPTHRRAKWFGTGVDRLENGKVVEMWHEMDMWGLVEQLQTTKAEG
jgi:predicted ester cyclase